ncbi:MAG: sigma-70 family RNA polymerase sigma factor [Myxococcaceae bacterium]|nr:sigma-70 family RNA polymerase sigma factor [Myxococcaceae bacterium]
MTGGRQPISPDSDLVRRLVAKDEGAFLELVDRYHAGLLRFVTSFVRSPAAAEEVVQDTWKAFIEGIEHFEQRASLKTFLYRIAANRARTRAVRDHRTPTLSDLEHEGDEASPLIDRFGTAGNWLAPPTPWVAETADAILERKQAMEVLARAIEQLPEQQRAVVQLRDVEGLASDEVCEMLGISEVHQRVLLHRARTRLRAALEGHFSG